MKHRRQRRPRHRRTSPLLDDSTLAGRASKALGWSVGSTVLSKLSLFAVGVMLARLLGPHAFGTYAVAYVALLALLNVNDLGVGLAIVRWPADPARIVPTVTTLSVLGSVVIYAGCFLAAPAYASMMGAPAATPVVRVLAITVLSDAFTTTPAALLQRTFRQGRRAIADQVNVWLGTAVTVALAWYGLGPMSLAVGRVVGCMASAVLLVAFAPESLRLGYDPVQARALLRFGLPLAGANVVGYAVATADQLVVGRTLGAVSLGFYVLALNIASWPSTFFSQPLRAVGPAVFARIMGDAPAMRQTFLSAAGMVSAAAVPACLFLTGSARPLIALVYGARWLPAAAPLAWLAVLAAVQVFLVLAYDLLVVLARSRFLLTTQLVWLAALVPALVAGARADGISGAALAELAVAVLLILPRYGYELRRAGIGVRALCARLWLPGAAGLCTCCLAAATGLVFSAVPALAASGIPAGLLMCWLVYRLRGSLPALREPPAGLAGPPGHAGPGHVACRDAAQPAVASGRAAEHLGAGRDARGTGWTPEPAAARDIRSYWPARLDPAATSPLYRLTAADLGWDPAGAFPRRTAQASASPPPATASALTAPQVPGDTARRRDARARPDDPLASPQ